ncbi:MAG TPA: LytTR family DNA-binding domain-containing protein [Gemmatimonadaceae bacterium]|nr:LytTR family DNA-binding domain-containing protein [Gemmatimonadaceae bacterium]
MRRVVIADDEPLARQRLRMMLARHPEFIVVAECRDGQEAVDALVAERPDAIFLDVAMPALDGFEVLEVLEAESNPAVVVFVTAFADRAVPAFDANAADFLLKPYDQSRFDRAIERVEARLGRLPSATSDVLRTLPRPLTAERFLVRGTNHLYFVRTADVEWIDAAANYVRLHAGGRVHFVRDTMKHVIERLPAERFLRVHRSMIVNVEFIQRLEPAEHGEFVVTMRDGKRIQTARTYNEQVRAFLRR